MNYSNWDDQIQRKTVAKIVIYNSFIDIKLYIREMHDLNVKYRYFKQKVWKKKKPHEPNIIEKKNWWSVSINTLINHWVLDYTTF